jgi:dCMP deaminase
MLNIENTEAYLQHLSSCAETMLRQQIRQEKWDRRFLDVAKMVSSWSKDPSSQIGAVIVNDNRHIVATGYNGFPIDVKDTPERYADRELKYKLVVHAEINSIIQAGHKAKGGTLYVYPGWGLPCMCTECSKAAIQAGIVRVVGLQRSIDAEKLARWKESLAFAETMCIEAGIKTEMLQEIT